MDLTITINHAQKDEFLSFSFFDIKHPIDFLLYEIGASGQKAHE